MASDKPRVIQPLNLQGCHTWADLFSRVAGKPDQRLLVYPILCAALVRKRGTTLLDDALFQELLAEVRSGRGDDLSVESGDGFVVIGQPTRGQS